MAEKMVLVVIVEVLAHSVIFIETAFCQTPVFSVVSGGLGKITSTLSLQILFTLYEIINKIRKNSWRLQWG